MYRSGFRANRRQGHNKPSKTALCTIGRKPACTTKAAFCKSRQHSRRGQMLKIIIDASQKMKRIEKLKSNPIYCRESSLNLGTEEYSANGNEILHQLRSGRDYESRIKEALSSAYFLAEHDILGESKPVKKRRFRVPPINTTKHQETKAEKDTRGYASRQLTSNVVAIDVDDLLSMFPLGEMTQSGPETNDSREQIAKSIKSKLSGICGCVSNMIRHKICKAESLRSRVYGSKEYGCFGRLASSKYAQPKLLGPVTTTLLQVSKILDSITSSRIFRFLSPSEATKLIMKMKMIERSPGDPFDPKTSFFVLEYGKMLDCNNQKLTTGDKGGEENLIFDFEGDSHVIDGACAHGSFHVIEKSKIWLLSKENFRDVLAEQGQILHASLSQNEWLTGNDTHLKLCRSIPYFTIGHYENGSLLPQGLHYLQKGSASYKFLKRKPNREVWEKPEETIKRASGPGHFCHGQAHENLDYREFEASKLPTYRADSNITCFTIRKNTLEKILQSGAQATRGFERTWDSPKTSGNEPRSLNQLDIGRSYVQQRFGHGKFSSFLAVRCIEETKTKGRYRKKKFHVRCTVKDSNTRFSRSVREKCILAQVNNRFITNLLRVTETERALYIALEPTSGGSLRTCFFRHENICICSNDLRYYIASTIIAMAYLHDKGIAHRGVSCQNIGITSRGYVKLCGFQNSKFIDACEHTYTVCGIPEYMSPEMILYRGHSTFTDLWSLGIVLYEMLYGVYPFKGSCHFETCMQILQGKPPRITTRATVATVHARNLMEGLLKPFPDYRLGCNIYGTGSLKNHVWFENFLWDQLENKSLTPPFAPDCVKKKQVDEKCGSTMHSDKQERTSYPFKTIIPLKDYMAKEFNVQDG